MFDLPRIAASRLVRHIDYHDEVGSTSDRALELAAQDAAPLPLLVLARRQTGGRGRGVNRWWSADGALTFSLVLEANSNELPLAERGRVALVIGLAVAEALGEFLPALDWRVKWPNDVYVAGGKACGILCESVPGWPERLVVGIGINVNNSLAGAPEDVQLRARALCDLPPGGRESLASSSVPQSSDFTRQRLPTPSPWPGYTALDLNEVLLAVLDAALRRWSDLLAGRHEALAAAYRQRCLLTGQMVKATSGGQTLVGRCGGIDPRGALVLHTESGPRAILSGTIESWE